MAILGSLKLSPKKVVNSLPQFVEIILNSYSQVFFSMHKGFAILILFVSFFDVFAGLFGFLAVITSAITSLILGFNKDTIRKGLLGFNSLLVGLGLGVYFNPSMHLFIIVILASVFTLFISTSLLGVIGKYGLPFLSIPFILGLWAFLLASNSFSVLGLNERGIFTLNELYALGGNSFVEIYDYVNNINLPGFLRSYLISMSAILFQFNTLSGMVVAIGLLIFSRIAFSLSLVGFFLAYGFYKLIGAEIADYDYVFFGFNYILSSIALGGFFLIPSRRAYFWMIFLIPLVAILTISLNKLFLQFRLPIYSLPFNMVVLLFLYTLKFREKYSYNLSEVYFQYNSPEKNLYIFLNNKNRFRYKLLQPIKLPFFGSWTVSQAHDGEYTHKGVYRHAWDFIIENNEGKQFKNNGDYPEDYFCFNKPVVAPEKGIIEDVADGIEDNIVGQINTENNWGNTIIIKHDKDVYSKICHLKNGSIKVKKGEEVQYGQIIAHCGNSGRSPYPHLHFQMQQYPYIDSMTLDYPIQNYILYQEKGFVLKTHEKPLIKQTIANIETSDLLVNAFKFIPGQIIDFEISDSKKIIKTNWEVIINEYNQSYFYCSDSGSKAFFENDKSMFYFTHFEGTKKCYLFYFFRAIYKVQTGFYSHLEIIDSFPLYLTYPKFLLWFYDFISPFVLFAKSEYRITYSFIDDTISPTVIELNSEMRNLLGKKLLNKNTNKIKIGEKGIEEIIVKENMRTIKFNR